MKFKKLIIENIASIEKAEIDFEHGPIERNPIFLICGETGSGKSTILDAICLALYANTPRISNSKGYVSKDQEGKEIKFKDEKQLLRRGANNAIAELHFLGNDQKEYIIAYKIRTKRGQAKTLEDSRELTSLSTGETWTKKIEINDEIERIIGMKYDQFCKTSLLAQGEFTKFLSSDEKEKSDILEKLTGTEIYSQIGKEIFKRQKNVSDDLKTQRGILESMQFLTPEIIQNFEAEKEEIQRQKEEKGLQKTSVNSKKNWLMMAKSIKEEIIKSKENLSKWEGIIQNPEYTQRKELLKKWDETTEVRGNIKSLKEKESLAEELRKEEISREREYQGVQNGLAWLNLEEKALKSKIEEIRKEIEKERVNETMYDSFDLIQDNLKGYLESLHSVQAEKAKAEKEEMKLPQYKRSLDENEKKWKEALSKKQEIEDSIQQLGNDLKAYNFEQLDRTIKQLREAADLSKQYEREQTEWANLEINLEKAIAQHQQLTVTIPQEEKQYQIDKENEEEKQKKLDNLKMAVDDAVKRLRHALKAGDECPICGKKIDSIVKDEEFEQAIFPFEEEVKRAKEAVLKSLEQLTKSKSDFAQISAQIKEWKEKGEALKSAIEATQSQLNQISDALSIPSSESKFSDFITEKAKETERKQNEGRELQNKMISKRNESEVIYKQIQECANRNNNINLEINTCQAEIKRYKGLAQSHSENGLKLKSKAAQLITLDNWERDIPSFISQLETSVKRHKSNKNEAEELNQRITNIQNKQSHIQPLLEKINMLFPSWGREGSPHQMEHLLDVTSSFATHCTVLDSNKRNNEKAATDLRSKINDFINKNGYTNDELAYLQTITKEKRDEIFHTISQTESEKNKAEGAYKNCQARHLEHQATRPDGIDENCTIELLSAEIERLEDDEKRLIERYTEINEKIKADQKNHDQAQNTQDKINKIQIELSKWDKLNHHFGSSDGKSFRLIAQSYVLRQLLHNANGYLKQLNDRYELSCAHNSLGILVQDFYIGGSLRPCNTLSGGESFIVSLALALGLSSLNGCGLTTDIIFIDEGFGTLSAEYLDAVMSMLEKLHNLGGKKVGIISHVDVLKERIPAQIRVKKKGNNGKSEVTICG